jgi:isopentenyl-diphosphate delta-isomerase
MAQETGKRKLDHIRICLEEKAQAKTVTAGFEDLQFVHRALPELDKAQINLSTTFLGHKFSAPIIVGAMTGGAEAATQINSAIAEAVEALGLGMGLGSQRAAIENHTLEQTYRVARDKAPHAFLIANVGGV